MLWNLLLHVMYAICCCMFCAKSCFISCMLCTATCFVPRALLLHMLIVYCVQLYALCCGHCRFMPRVLLLHILYAVHCHKFCAVGTAASYYIVCCVLPCHGDWCFVLMTLLLDILHAVYYCIIFCIMGTATSYIVCCVLSHVFVLWALLVLIIVLCTDIHCWHCSILPRMLLFHICMLCTATGFVLKALLLHILYDVCRRHCCLILWVVLLYILYTVDHRIFCVHCCFICVSCCVLMSAWAMDIGAI